MEERRVGDRGVRVVLYGLPSDRLSSRFTHHQPYRCVRDPQGHTIRTTVNKHPASSVKKPRVGGSLSLGHVSRDTSASAKRDVEKVNRRHSRSACGTVAGPSKGVACTGQHLPEAADKFAVSHVGHRQRRRRSAVSSESIFERTPAIGYWYQCG